MSDMYMQDTYEQEVFKNSKTKIFKGREEEIEKVKSYIDRETFEPFIVHGKSGIGKSAFMAKLTDVILGKIDQTKRDYPVYFRFIGATAASSDIKTLLKSLLSQLYKEGAIDKPVKRGDLLSMPLEEIEYEDGTSRFFEQVSKLLTDVKKPVIIILDALEQLQEKDYLQWLPMQLSNNLKMIVSTTDDMDTHYYEVLKARANPTNMLKLNGLSSGSSKNILDALLEGMNRKLTPIQEEYVLGQIKKSGNIPLYIIMAFEEIKTWKSFDKYEKLSVGVDSVIQEYIDNLIDKFHHDKYVVQKVFGLIKASKDGLSESEILDLLSRDDSLLGRLENFGHSLILTIDGNKVRRFPISVWARLHEKIKPFLMTRLIDGQKLIKFFHRQIDDVVGNYIHTKRKLKLHQELASYFLMQQHHDRSWDERYSNQRMLEEIPYQLFHAKNSEGLKKILFDLEFVGSIYGHKKEHSYKDILNVAELIKGISKEEMYPWISFYREKEHLILLVNKDWFIYQTLFQLAYEDGKNSPLHINANQLALNNKINWERFNQLNIASRFSRRVKHSYRIEDNRTITPKFNCITLDQYFVFYYEKIIYIFRAKAGFRVAI